MEIYWEQPAADALQSSLLLIAAGGTLWYCVRIVAALALLAVSRWRPALRGAAVRCAPSLLRPLIGRMVLGGLLAAGLTGPAAWAGDGCGPGAQSPPLLDRGERCGATDEAGPPAGSGDVAASTPDGGAGADSTGKTFTVSAGDSLWSITGQLLGESGTPQRIAAAWPGLWQANAAIIGADPGLIHPGQTLSVPADLGSGASR